jgi:murein DD-endopeptidase MepM/ murein hydrolase activator NlpD
VIRRPIAGPDGPTARRSRRALVLFAAFVLLLPLIAGISSAPPTATGDDLADAVARQKALAAQIADQKAQVARLNALQADLKGQIATTNAALAGVNADLGAVKLRIAKLGDEIATVKTTYAGLVAQLANLDRQLASIQAQEAEKAADLSTRKAILAQRLRAAYATDRTSLLETILSADSFSTILTDVGYLMDFGEQDKLLAQQIAHDQEVLAALQQSVTETRTATDALRVETAHQRAELASRIGDLKVAQAQLKKLQAETAKQLAIQRANYAKLQLNKAAVAKAIRVDEAAQAELKSKIADIIARQRQLGNIPSEYNGTLTWPMAGLVTQEYGCTGFPMEPPVGSCAHFHQGIDIAAPMYTPIRAAGDGTVLFAGPNPYDSYPKAWIVIIAHSADLQTWYAHIDDANHPPTVRAGEFVHQGDIIAYEGMTGHTTGPHLHWMVELNNDFVNPRLFV